MTKTTTPGTGRPPLIGLTGRRRPAAVVAGFPASLGHLEVDLHLTDYAREVVAAGGLPVQLPSIGDPRPYVDRLDGLLLTGGCDVEPGRYGAEPDGNGDYEADRDELELTLLGAALETGLPVLAICRGLQVLNVHAGGTLHQHLPDHARFDVDPADDVHQVTFDPGTRLHELYGSVIETNSLHHQAVEAVGRGLAVTGRAGDGTVEALELVGAPVLAVQWHPEMRNVHEPVFDWLIEQARPWADE
jgi:putative glutamine amidotransferase